MENDKEKANNAENKTPKKLSEQSIFLIAIVGVIVLFGALFFVFYFKPLPTGNAVLNDNSNNTQQLFGRSEVAATVNGEKILVADVEKRFKTVPAELSGQVTKTSILTNMIDGELLLQEAQKNNVAVQDSEVEKIFTEQKTAVDEIISLGGFSEPEVKNTIKESLIVQKFLNENVFAKIEISGQEVSVFFEENKDDLKQVNAAHILVESEEKAKELLQKINDGADFAALAKENSTDTGSAQKGGELGFFTKPEVVPEFGEAAFSLKVGEVSEIVKSQFGYHILKVIAIKENKEDFTEQIQQILKQQKSDQAYKDLLAKLKAEAQIEILFKETTTA